MRTLSVGSVSFAATLAGLIAVGGAGRAQAPPGVQSTGGTAGTLFTVPSDSPPYGLDDALLRWPLPAGAPRYGAIDGRRLHTFVVEQANISRRFRDQGHPQYWGRIIGSSADAESASQ